mgnify:CR=1 FL=1
MVRAKMPLLLIQELAAQTPPAVGLDFLWVRLLLPAGLAWLEPVQLLAWVWAWVLERVPVAELEQREAAGAQPAPPCVSP